jgi:hypothetical protein
VLHAASTLHGAVNRYMLFVNWTYIDHYFADLQT